MRLILQDDPVELEGTHKVVIHADESSLRPGGRESPSQFVTLKVATRSCGAIVERIDDGNQAITMDKYLRIYLRARTGDPVEVEYADLPSAESLKVAVPAEYERKGLTQLVRDSLNGKPFSQGQPVPLFITPLT
ncbi:MAG: hypothetical protein JSV10_06225 [Candidatus Zixiibacteriota bacterium]|nr:MAG: hypothetical protein JSV10_06225 [candidate division Zixibacteria bacterium]